MERDYNKISETGPFCPVTGLRIFQKPEWRNISIGEKFSLTLSVIGKNILLTKSRGYCSRKDSEKSMKFINQMLGEILEEGEPYIHISDYSKFRGASISARKHYMGYLKKQGRICCLIFYGTMPLVNMSIKLVKRITRTNYDIEVVDDYQDAMEIAVGHLKEIRNLSTEQTLHGLYQKTKSFSESESQKQAIGKRDWNLQMDGLSIKFEIFEEDIIHTISEGFLREEHVEPLHRLRKKVADSIHSQKGAYSIIANVSGIKGGSRKARRLLMTSLQDTYREKPFDYYLFYGANWFTRTAMNLAKPFLPFKGGAVKDFESALRIIREGKKQISLNPFFSNQKNELNDDQHAGKVKQYVNDLIHYIGSIHWDKEGVELTEMIDALHPFTPVFDSIAFIKGELDDLFRERDRIEQELKLSKERYQTILQSIEDGYFEVDLNGTFTFANDSMGRILGFTRDKIIGMNNREYMDEENAEKVYRVFNEVFKTGLPRESFDWEIVQKGGSRKILEASVSCIKDSEGHPLGFRGIVRDITTRKKAEEIILKSREDLEMRVAERTKQLAQLNENLNKEIKVRRSAQEETIKAKEMAENANRAKSEFLANMSHELRTPLNHIIGFTELVVDKTFGDLNEVQEEYLNDVHHSSMHLLSLIKDILDLSKVEAGKLVFEPSSIQLRNLLEDSLIMVKEKAMKHGIKLSTDIKRIPKVITADERKLKQVLYNLLFNAVKFTPDDGEIRLKAELVDDALPLIDNSSKKASTQGIEGISDERKTLEKCIRISVTDTGIGINQEDLERIFRPFEQAENSPSRKFQGTGLGLSLTKNLVELHGGKIWAKSEGEGKGSKFWFVIPLEKIPKMS